MTTLRPHIPALDGVRGIAILLVLMAHLTVFGSASAADRMSFHAIVFGLSGVDLFFVLSGFLITAILWTSRGPRALPRFWIRRVLRIWPLYLAALGVLFIALPLVKGWQAYPMNELWADRWYYWLHATNIKIATQGRMSLPYNSGHFWSLAVEEQFYLLWPLVVWRTRTLDGLLRVSCGVIAASWILRCLIGGPLNDPNAAYVLMPTRMDGLAFGAAIFALSALGRLDRLRRPALIIAGASFLVALSPFKVPDGWSTTNRLAASLFHAAFLTIILTGSSALADRPWLRFFGKYSYGIYVIHYPLLLAVTPFKAWATTLPTLAGWSLPASLVFFTGCTALTLVFALASYHFVEAPILSFKRYFYEPHTQGAAYSGSSQVADAGA